MDKAVRIVIMLAVASAAAYAADKAVIRIMQMRDIRGN